MATGDKTYVQKVKDFVNRNKIAILIIAIIAAYAFYQKQGKVSPAPTGHLRYYYF
jgi:hypothetical protein